MGEYADALYVIKGLSCQLRRPLHYLLEHRREKALLEESAGKSIPGPRVGLPLGHYQYGVGAGLINLRLQLRLSERFRDIGAQPVVVHHKLNRFAGIEARRNVHERVRPRVIGAAVPELEHLDRAAHLRPVPGDLPGRAPVSALVQPMGSAGLLEPVWDPKLSTILVLRHQCGTSQPTAVCSGPGSATLNRSCRPANALDVFVKFRRGRIKAQSLEQRPASMPGPEQQLIPALQPGALGPAKAFAGLESRPFVGSARHLPMVQLSDQRKDSLNYPCHLIPGERARSRHQRVEFPPGRLVGGKAGLHPGKAQAPVVPVVENLSLVDRQRRAAGIFHALPAFRQSDAEAALGYVNSAFGRLDHLFLPVLNCSGCRRLTSAAAFLVAASLT